MSIWYTKPKGLYTYDGIPYIEVKKMKPINKVFELRTYYMVLQQKLENAGVSNGEIKQASFDLWEKINELEKSVKES